MRAAASKRVRSSKIEALATAGAERPKPPEAGAPLALVHGGAPWQANGGAVFLDAVAKHVGRPCIHVSISLEGRPLPVPADFPRPVIQIIGRGGLSGVGWLQSASPWAARQLYWSALYPALLRRRTALAVRELAAHRPIGLAIFLNALEVPSVGATLASLLGIPYSTMEWDLLDEGIDALGLAGPLHRRAIQNLASLRAGAVKRGVASEGMEMFYRREWGLDSLVLRQPAVPRAVTRHQEAGAPFVIALCGNVYAVNEFRCLVDALTRLGWSAAGRPIELRVIGMLGSEAGDLPPQVRVTGWVSYDESLDWLADADLGYCPYWFEAERARVVTTSFPSKVISYLTCGVPVFYHGPKTGTPAAMLARYPVGFCCHSLDVAAVGSAVAALIGAPERLSAARAAAEEAVAGEFAAATLTRRLATWVGEAGESR